MISSEGALFGLKRLVEAERRLAEFLLSNKPIELSDEITAVIQWVIDNAAELRGDPNFKLSDEQEAALWQIFRNRISIITGPPGTGKTTIMGLANVIATMIYPNVAFPGLGITLAALAANN